MPRSGRLLELLIKQLQATISSNDVDIKSPELFYENGVLIGEIDITLRSKIGSVEIFVGIECRNRKAKGDRPWIQQIMGKRDDLKVHKMIAVANEFTIPAKNLAREKGISLITITDIDNFNIKNWIKEFICLYESYCFEVIEMNYSFNAINKEIYILISELILILERRAPIFLSEYIVQEVNKFVVNLNKNKNKKNKNKYVYKIFIPKNANVIINGVIKIVNYIEITVGIKVTYFKQIVILDALIDESDKIIGMAGVCEFYQAGNKRKLLITSAQSTNDITSRDVSFSFVDSELKPYFWPDSQLKFYGLRIEE